MKTFGNLSLSEGSDITNLTVSRGPTFPANGNSGELFYYTGVGQDVGLYINDGTSWVLAVVNDTKFKGRVADSISARYAIFGGNANQTVSNSPLTVQFPVTVFADSMVVPTNGTFNKLDIIEAGLYEITYSLTLVGGNSAWEAYLAVNGGQIARTSGYGFTPNNTTDKVTLTGRHIISLNVGNDIRLMVRRIRGSGTATVVAADLQLIFNRLR